jgi:hypothetical protein
MKKISVLVCISLFSFVPAFSQPTQAEIDKRIKDAQNKVSDTTAFLLAPRNIKLLNSLPIRTFNRDRGRPGWGCKIPNLYHLR